MNLGALVATLGVNSAGLVKAQKDMLAFEKKTNASLTRINAKLATTGAAMKKVGKAMTMYLTLPMALVGGAAVKMSMDFESSMSKIVGLVGIAREQVDQWGQDILKMAPQLGKAPKELADALFFITSAGIRGAEAMDVLKMSAKASVSGLGETKVVADLVTSAMNAYGKETLNAQLATDVLTAAVREGKAEATALASSMGMVLPIASNMGVQFHEVGAAVAAMTRTGTSAATASMQLRQILASMLKPTQQAEEALWNMNTSSAALRKTIKQDGLLAALMQIRKLTAQYGETVMSDVFPNIRALSGALDIMGTNLKDNQAIFASLEQAAGSGAKAFAAAAETFEFKWNQATASVKTGLTVFGKTIAEELIPILVGFTERIKNLISWFKGLDDTQRQMIVRVGALVMVLGPLMRILGFLVGNILPTLLRLGTGVVKMFMALKVAMAWNPWVILGIGLAAVVTALTAFKKKTDDATESQKNLTKAWKDAANITPTIEEQIKVMGEMNKRQVEDLRGAIQQKMVLNKQYDKEAGLLVMAQMASNKSAESENTKILQLHYQQRIVDLQKYLTQVNSHLKTFGKGDPTTQRTEIVPMIFGVDEQNMLQDLGLAKKYAYEKVDILAEANNAIIQDMIAANEIVAGIEQQEMERRRLLAQNTEWYVGIVTNAFRGMSNVISDALNSSEGFLESFGTFFKNFIKGMIFRLIAATIAALALVMVISLLPGFGGAGAFKAIKEAGTFGKMMTAGIGTFMAEGGAISGPTLAMVGEAPNISRSNPEFIGTAAQLGLDKLGGQSGSQKVIFEIEGTTLKGVLSNIERQTNSYS